MSTNPPDPETVLARLSSLMRLLYEAFETAVSNAKAYFDTRNKPINRWLLPALVRYEVKEFLAEHGHKAEEEEEFAQADIPNNGLLLRAAEYQTRILKADQGGVPAPGSSKARQDYFNQQLPLGFDNVASEGQSHYNLVLVWDVDENYVLKGLRLAYPRSGTANSVELHWIVDVPHPALTISRDTPSTREPAEDLAIELDEEEKETGTEGPA